MIHIARQIAGALARAHELNIVHRDLKPENIMGVVAWSRLHLLYWQMSKASEFLTWAALLAVTLILLGCTIVPAPASPDLNSYPVDLGGGKPADMTCVAGKYAWICGTDCPENVPVCGATHGVYVVGDGCEFPGARCEQFDRYAYCDCTGKVIRVECTRGPTPDGGSC